MKRKMNAEDLAGLKRADLYEMARELKISNCSKMKKEELLAVILSASAEKKGTAATKKSAATEKPAKAAKKAEPAKEKAKKTAPAKTAPTKKAATKTAPEKIIEQKTPVDKKPSKTKATRPAAAKEEKPKRGRPAGKSRPATEEKASVEMTGAEKRLDRGFGKKAEDAPKPRHKKGAEVLQPAVAIPVETALRKDNQPTIKAREIEKERSKRHASLKTTMEIPLFPASEPEILSSVREEDLTGDLPTDYGETRIVMQIRDPHWAYIYWDLPPIELKRLELEVGIFEFAHSHFVLRVHDVSHGWSHEIKLTDHARNWYIYLEHPQTVYQVELGMQSPSEGYTFISLSNLVQTPPDQVSQRWAPPVPPEPEPQPEADPEAEERIAGHEFARPLSRQAQTAVKSDIARFTDPGQVYFSTVTGEKLSQGGSSDLLATRTFATPDMPTSAMPGSHEMPGSLNIPSSFNAPSSFNMPSSHMPSSHSMPSSDTMPSSEGVSSLSRPAKKKDNPFLTAAADLIIYGSVRPGCELFFHGNAVRVRPDGTYSLRLALPFDGCQTIELVAVDSETAQTDTIKAEISLKND